MENFKENRFIFKETPSDAGDSETAISAQKNAQQERVNFAETILPIGFDYAKAIQELTDEISKIEATSFNEMSPSDMGPGITAEAEKVESILNNMTPDFDQAKALFKVLNRHSQFLNKFKEHVTQNPSDFRQNSIDSLNQAHEKVLQLMRLTLRHNPSVTKEDLRTAWIKELEKETDNIITDIKYQQDNRDLLTDENRSALYIDLEEKIGEIETTLNNILELSTTEGEAETKSIQELQEKIQTAKTEKEEI